jgi:hypothetical protein
MVRGGCQNGMCSDFDQLLRLADSEWHVRIRQESGELTVRHAAFGFREHPPDPHVGCYHLGNRPARLANPTAYGLVPSFVIVGRWRGSGRQRFCGIRGGGCDQPG